jgi:hypothetical protein
MYHNIIFYRRGSDSCRILVRSARDTSTELEPRSYSQKAISPQTCRICPSYTHFPPTPCFVHREHTKLPVVREGTLVPSFVLTKVPFFLQQLLIAPVKLSRGGSSSFFFITTGPAAWPGKGFLQYCTLSFFLSSTCFCSECFQCWSPKGILAIINPW